MHPFPPRRILSDEQILILSVAAQNPPVLLPPKRVCLLSICLCSRSRRKPLSDVSRKQRYNTLDFPGENRVPTGMLLAPIGNPEPKGVHPSGHPARPCSNHPSGFHTMDAILPKQVKQAQHSARTKGELLCLFLPGKTEIKLFVLFGSIINVGVRRMSLTPKL